MCQILWISRSVANASWVPLKGCLPRIAHAIFPPPMKKSFLLIWTIDFRCLWLLVSIRRDRANFVARGVVEAKREIEKNKFVFLLKPWTVSQRKTFRPLGILPPNTILHSLVTWSITRRSGLSNGCISRFEKSCNWWKSNRHGIWFFILQDIFDNDINCNMKSLLRVRSLLRPLRPVRASRGGNKCCNKRAYSSSTTSETTDLIPIVDVSSFFERDDKAHDIAKQISKALSEIGFVYIKNSPLTDDIINRCINASRRFFEQPQNSKDQIHTTDANSFGYYHYQGVGDASRP